MIDPFEMFMLLLPLGCLVCWRIAVKQDKDRK